MLSLALHAASLAPLHSTCSIGASEDPGKVSVRIGSDDCEGSHHCGSNFSNESLSRFNGITLADLGRDGAKLTATLTAEAGTFTCSGTVRDRELQGQSVFTPDDPFVARMERMGFTGFNSEKLMAYAFIGVDSKWVQSMQETGVHGMTVDNLIALRIFKITPEFIRRMQERGLTNLTIAKLVQIRIFKLDE